MPTGRSGTGVRVIHEGEREILVLSDSSDSETFTPGAVANNASNATSGQTRALRKPSPILLITTAPPIDLVPREKRQRLVDRCNRRLDRAQAEGISLSEITIGQDCLPTWESMFWDPEVESLAQVVQHQMEDMHAADGLGSATRKDTVSKATQRLKDALAAGITLQQMYYDLDLLPAWSAPITDVCDREGRGHAIAVDDAEEGVNYTTEGQEGDISSPDGMFDLESVQDQEECDEMSSTDVTGTQDSGYYSQLSETPDAPLRARRAILSSDNEYDADDDSEMEEVTTVVESARSRPLDQANDPLEDSSDRHMSDNDSESSETVTDDDMEEIMDPEANVIHDVEVQGGAAHMSAVDLEVYLMEEDSEVNDLPTVEVAVDRELYELHHGAEDAVDVELPGIDVRCTGTVEPSGSEAVIQEPPSPRSASPASTFRRLKRKWWGRISKEQREEIERDVAAASAGLAPVVACDDDDYDDDDVDIDGQDQERSEGEEEADSSDVSEEETDSEDN